jgi:hypothetical protein
VMANEVDNDGFTPFLRFIEHYASWVPSNLSHLRGGSSSSLRTRHRTRTRPHLTAALAGSMYGGLSLINIMILQERAPSKPPAALPVARPRARPGSTTTSSSATTPTVITTRATVRSHARATDPPSACLSHLLSPSSSSSLSSVSRSSYVARGEEAIGTAGA